MQRASAARVPYGLPLLISKIDWCHFYVNDAVRVSLVKSAGQGRGTGSKIL